MTRCKGCGREFRKGTLAFLLMPKGPVGARVCQSCASGGVLLVAPKVLPASVQKVVRSDGVERALRQLRAIAEMARKQIRDPAHAGFEIFHQGRAEGYEAAIELLKRECGI